MLFLDEQSVRDVEQDVRRWVDLWPTDGPGPTGADALSAALAVAVAAYDGTRPLEARVMDGIRDADGRVAYDYESAKAIERLTLLWLVPVPRAHRAIAAARRAGGVVDGVDAFALRVEDAELGTNPSVEQAREMMETWARNDPESFRYNLRWPAHAV